MTVAGEHVLVNRGVAINTVSNFIGKLVNLLTWFFLTPFILAQLGNAMYGLWVLVGSVASYGSLFDLGIASAVTKYIAEYTAREDHPQASRIIVTSLFLYITLGVIVFAAITSLRPFFLTLFNISAEQRELSMTLLGLSGLAIGVSIPCTLTAAILKGLQRFDLVNLTGTLGTLLSAACMVAALLNGWGAIGLVVSSIAVILLMQIPAIWLIHQAAPGLKIHLQGNPLASVRQVVSFSFALFLLNLNGFLETKTDEIVIGAYMPLARITPYNLALRLSSLPQLLTAQFLAQILPLSSALAAKQDEARIRALYLSSTRITLALFLPVGLATVLLAGPILGLWVGEQYSTSEPLVVIITTASLIDTSQWPAGLILQGMARHRKLALISILSGILNLILSVVLVQRIGLIGVALGTLIPTSLVCLLFVLPYSMRLLQISLRQMLAQVFLPALIPALPTAACLWLFASQAFIQKPVYLLAAIAAGGIIYASGYLCLKNNSAERAAVLRLANKLVNYAKSWIRSG